MSDGVEGEFRQRWTALGLAETAVALAPDSTITPHTLPLAEWGGLAAAPKVDPGELSRISVEVSAAAGAARDPDLRSSADLMLLRTLGEGGMGRVHLARQRSLARDVAVKALKEDAAASAADALLHEARLAGSLEHPGVIPVHALGLDDAGRPLLVMKRVDGVEWRELLERPDHPLLSKRGATDALSASLEIMIQLCQTLEFAHSRSVVHLDIKPENVMIGEYGEVYLLDWGIARKLDGSARAVKGIVGTPAYMAPEMVLGHAVDQRTDVYLLGATLHEVLTGRRRHDGPTLESVLLAAALSTPAEYDAEVPEALAELANRATAGDPGLRPPSAEAFRHELGAFLRSKSANALTESANERLVALETTLRDAAAGAPPADLARAHGLATECRFGFAQALREHPTHPGALEGAERALLALIDLELRQEHADTARALVRELSAPPGELVQRIEAAEQRAATRGRERERLMALDRDLDPTMSSTARGIALGLTALAIVTIMCWVVFVQGLTNLSSQRLLNISAILVIVISSAVYVGRKALLSNAFNRRLAFILVFSVLGSFVNRTLSLLLDTAPATTVATDLTLFMGATAGGAIAVFPALWWSVALFGLGIALARARPHWALPVFSITALTNVALLAYLLWRETRKRRKVDLIRA